jgi:hypothetical protein
MRREKLRILLLIRKQASGSFFKINTPPRGGGGNNKTPENSMLVNFQVVSTTQRNTTQLKEIVCQISVYVNYDTF